MSWAAGRRAIILAVVGVVLLIIAGGIAYLVLHKAPSCTDGKQNRDEEGIDCGGNFCTYLCATGLVQPSVSFVRQLPQAGGRTDVVAYLKNPNASAAAVGVHYKVELYDANRAVIASKDSVANLAPGADTPVYLANFFSGNATIDRAFVTIDDASYKWVRDTATPMIPMVASPQVSGTIEAPRVTAAVTNPFSTALRAVKLTATVFDEAGNAIAASQTVIPEILPQGRADAIFTWNAPFPGTVSRIDVKPSVPVPLP